MNVVGRTLALAVALAFAATAVAACGLSPSQRLSPGTAVLDATEEATSTPTASVSAPASADPSVGREQVLRAGDSGSGVQELQRLLASAGYWLGEPDGEYGPLTVQAVLALQKVAGLSPDGVVGPKTRAALRRDVRPTPLRVTGSGVEVDLRRQLLIHVKDGVPRLTLNVSTGSGVTYRQDGSDQVAVTPTGRYTVYREVDGRDVGPLGELWRPKYVVGGVAIHGYPSVPAFPASHGCIRVSNAAMDHLWSSGVLPLGTSVWVY